MYLWNTILLLKKSTENGGSWTRTNESLRLRDLQSLAIAAMRYPLETMLEKGIEPSTVRLQGGCSTVELLQQLDENFIAKSCFTLKNYLNFYFQEG